MVQFFTSMEPTEPKLINLFAISIVMINTTDAASIHIEGMDMNFISMLYKTEPVNPPICIVNEFTDNTEALILFGVSEFKIMPSGIVAIPNNRYIEAYDIMKIGIFVCKAVKIKKAANKLRRIMYDFLILYLCFLNDLLNKMLPVIAEPKYKNAIIPKSHVLLLSGIRVIM